MHWFGTFLTLFGLITNNALVKTRTEMESFPAVIVVVQLATIALMTALADGGFYGRLLAGLTTMMVLSVPNTLLLVAAHARRWRMARLQICVVRIVLMVPVYAISSWIGLQSAIISEWPVACSASGEWRSCGLADGVRELYGAFAIYSFVCYLLRAFGSEEALAALLSKKAQHEHFWPLVYALPHLTERRARRRARSDQSAVSSVILQVRLTALAHGRGLPAALQARRSTVRHRAAAHDARRGGTQLFGAPVARRGGRRAGQLGAGATLEREPDVGHVPQPTARTC